MSKATEDKLVDRAKAMQDYLVQVRRHLHRYPEIGMDVENTVRYIKEQLDLIGCEYEDVYKNGIMVSMGSGEGAILLRADTDALPITELTEEPFKSENGNMHACGHDFHVAMMIGATQLIKGFADRLNGIVKLVFQPGEETMQGAKAMIEGGILDSPPVRMAISIHVITAVDVPSGTFLIPTSGNCTASCDWFEVEVSGEGGHGAMPEATVDPLYAANKVYGALNTIAAREISAFDPFVLTIGEMHAGNTANVIPNKAVLRGTIRTFDETTRRYAKNRVCDISKQTALAFRAKADVKIIDGCPSVKNDRELRSEIMELLIENFSNQEVLPLSTVMRDGKIMASEDFGFYLEKTRGVLINLAVGSIADGYRFPQHHSMTNFDETHLYKGALAYALIAKHFLT